MAWDGHAPIPGDLMIDHICLNTSCVNVEHLRLMSTADNVRGSRTNQAKMAQEFCPRGHPYASNT